MAGQKAFLVTHECVFPVRTLWYSHVRFRCQSSYGMVSYVHNGRQYVMLQTGSKLSAMAPGEF
jgi:hypothetical protein